jgi:hypothetical protein
VNRRDQALVHVLLLYVWDHDRQHLRVESRDQLAAAIRYTEARPTRWARWFGLDQACEHGVTAVECEDCSTRVIR